MSMSLRNYGYSTKKEYNERMDAIKCAVIEYGIQPVYERLVKLGEFNPVMKEDAESVAQIYELTALTNLDIASNNFTGKLPACLRKQGKVVHVLSLDYNSFSGPLPQALNYPDLRDFQIQRNCDEEGVAVEASVEAVVEAKAEKEPTWKALRPEGDKGVGLQKSCRNAPKMVTDMGDYKVQDNVHYRLQLLQDLAHKHGILAVLSMMANHLVTMTNKDQQKIMEGDMSALQEAYNEKMKAEAEASVEAEAEAEASAEASVEADVEASVEADVEASVEADVEASVEASVEAKAEASVEASVEADVEASVEAEGKVLFLEMLDTKLAQYKRQLSNLLDGGDIGKCMLAFDTIRENMVTAYNENIEKNKKIMEQKVEEFSKIAKIFGKYRNKVVEITKSYEYQYIMLNNMLTEMSNDKEQIVQDVLCSIVSVLKEHKQCDIVSLSELKKRQQFILQKESGLLNDINELVKKKSVAITECDIEGYDMLGTIIVSMYKQVIPLHVDALVYEIRIRDITSSIYSIPSPDDF